MHRSFVALMFVLSLLGSFVGQTDVAIAQEAAQVSNPTFIIDGEEAAYCTSCIEAEVIKHDEFFEYSMNPMNPLGEYNVWFFLPGTSFCSDADGVLKMQIVGGDPIEVPLSEGMTCLLILEGTPLMWMNEVDHLYFSRSTTEELAEAIGHPEATNMKLGFIPVPEE
jgi:hypothetical protein